MIKRIMLLLTVAFVVAAIGLLQAVPAFAQEQPRNTLGHDVYCGGDSSGIDDFIDRGGPRPFGICDFNAEEEGESGPIDLVFDVPSGGQSHGGT